MLAHGQYAEAKQTCDFLARSALNDENHDFVFSPRKACCQGDSARPDSASVSGVRKEFSCIA